MQTINSLVKNKTITEDNARELIRHIQVKDLTPFGKLLTTHPKKVYCIHIDKPLREILSNHTKNKKMKIETPVYAITNETESGPKNIWLLAHGTDALQTSQHEEYN
jgi:hypothetical protein